MPTPLKTDWASSPWDVFRVLNFALIAASILVATLTCMAVVTGYSWTPFVDSWSVFKEYYDAGFQVRLSSLFAMHNEHRPLIARVFLLADAFWAGGKGYLPVACIFLIQTAHAWLLWTIARKQSWFEIPLHWGIASAAAIFCCFSGTQLENLFWPYQISFVLSFFLATAATMAVAAQKEYDSPKWSALVFACALIAPLALASGVFVWWMAVLMAILVRLPRRWILIYVAAGVLTTAAYFTGYTRPEGVSDPIAGLYKPLQVLEYLGVYFGSTWHMWNFSASVRWWSRAAGAGLALAVVLLTARRAWAFAKRRPTNPWDFVPVILIAFLLLTALITALGRLDAGPEQALSGRYQTPALMFWCFGLMLSLSVIPRRALLPFLLICLSLMLLQTTGRTDGMAIMRVRKIRLDTAGAAWMSGVQDMDSMVQATIVNPLYLHRPFLERRFGLFGVMPAKAIGTQIDASRIQSCVGKFTQDAFFPSAEWPGVRLRGGARQTNGTEIDMFLVATSSDRRVVGVGFAHTAFAQVASADVPLTVYGVLPQDQLCPIESTITSGADPLVRGQHPGRPSAALARKNQ